MARGQDVYKQVISEHHARLERLAEKRGVGRLQRVYENAQSEVARKLQVLVTGRRAATFTAHQKRLVLAQLHHGQTFVIEQMGGELADAARDARRDSLRALSRDVRRLDKAFGGTAPVLPVEDAARFAGVIDKRETSMLKRHATSLDRYGARNVTKMEDELATSLLAGDSQSETIDRITEVADMQWWEGERIVRTELAWATNATHADGLEAARAVLPDLMMQWREFVSDDGEPLDDRVGADSIALHGQVVVPGEAFYCPPRTPEGEEVSESLVEDPVYFPPNRPNDRATVSPWRAGWDVPAWRWAGGRRVPMR